MIRTKKSELKRCYKALLIAENEIAKAVSDVKLNDKLRKKVNDILLLVLEESSKLQ